MGTVPTPRLDPPVIQAPVADTGAMSLPWIAHHQSVADQLAQLNANQGVVDGSDAAAGRVGEFMSSTVGAPGLAISNNVQANVTSLALSAGDWDVRGEVWFRLGTGTTGSVEAGISTVSASLPNDPGSGSRATQTFVHQASSGQVLALAPCRISLAAPATVYLVALCGYTADTTSAYGRLEARRVR